MASGHVNRIKRPNTWLHRPMLQNVKKALANPEPCRGRPEAAGPRSDPRDDPNRSFGGIALDTEFYLDEYLSGLKRK